MKISKFQYEMSFFIQFTINIIAYGTFISIRDQKKSRDFKKVIFKKKNN